MCQVILFQWLQNNLKHPYPTEETKRKLCKQTNLSLEQLNTWFINARQRYVKSRKVRAPLTKMVQHMWEHSQLDEILKNHMDIIITQSSYFLVQTTTWQQLLFWVTYVNEDQLNHTEFESVCETLIPTVDAIVALDLLYQAVLKQKFDFASILLRSGVAPVPLVCENGLCLKISDVCRAVTSKSNERAQEFIQLCEIVDFFQSTTHSEGRMIEECMSMEKCS